MKNGKKLLDNFINVSKNIKSFYDKGEKNHEHRLLHGSMVGKTKGEQNFKISVRLIRQKLLLIGGISIIYIKCFSFIWQGTKYGVCPK